MKKNKSKPLPCFVIMPFGEWFDEYYTQIYCPAIKAAGMEPQRSDDLYRPSNIVQDIWNYTKKAIIILAELTGKNPNVFYELGLAHALGKPAILITQTIDDIPFDLRSLRVIKYDKNVPDWGKVLQSNIISAIKETLADPEETVPPTFLGVKTTPASKVTKKEKEYLELRSRIDRIERGVMNNSVIHSTNPPIQRRSLSPREAEERIGRYLQLGMPNSLIIERLRHLGPPAAWIERKIATLKSHGSIKG